jgi:hypothetical protein
MRLSESIQALHYSFEPSVVSLCAYAVKSCPISSKCDHRSDIAPAKVPRLPVLLASVSDDECSPITYPHGHHKMPKNAVPHAADYKSQVIDQGCFSYSNVSHDRGEPQAVQIDQSRWCVRLAVVPCIVVLGVFFTLESRIIRFFPGFRAL